MEHLSECQLSFCSPEKLNKMKIRLFLHCAIEFFELLGDEK